MNKADIFEEYYTAQKKLEEQYGSQSIVLMMVGSFYEIYGVDLAHLDPPILIGKAEEAHNILGMNMTMKSKARVHSKNNPYMVGFPDYALDEHLGKFLRANMTVAIYDQYDICYTDSNGKQRTKKGRRRTHVYTPSTYIDDTQTETNCLLAFELTEYKSPVTKQILKKVHIAVLSLSTGKAYLLEAYDTREDTGKAEAELYRIIHTYNPSEVIYCGKADSKFAKIYDLGRKKVYFRTIPKTYHKSSYQNEFLKSIYACALDSLSTPIEYIGMEKHTSVLPHFIQALQFAYEQDKLIVTRIQKPEFVESHNQLVLNNDSIYQLNLVESPFEISNTLFDVICKARTAIGKRYIREQLLTPTMDITILNSRYDLIEQMRELYKEYENCLRSIADIEKKYRKMVLGTLHPYELADLRGTWSTIKSLLKMARKMFSISSKLIDDYECFYNEYTGNFDFAMMKKCKLRDVKGSFFLEGLNEELDEMDSRLLDGKKVLHKLAEDFSQWIEPYKECIVKVESTEKEGWYLSTTKTRFKKLPKDFTAAFTYHGKKYTIDWDDLELVNLKNTIKIRSPQIRRISHDIVSQRERMNQKITEEYLKILDHYSQDYGEMFMQLADTIAYIDFIYSAARVSVEYGYTRPHIKNKQKGVSYVNIKNIRHPIIEQINDEEEYITNDISLGIKEHYGSLIYGLNMCGKCFSKGTQILMANGRIKTVEDVRVGDKLMGDNFTHRNVLELARGRDQMYTIIPRTGDRFTVTSGHILCLMGRRYINTVWDKKCTRYRVRWIYNGIRCSESFSIYKYGSIKAAECAMEKLKQEIEELENDYIEITVEDYLKKATDFRLNYYLYTKPCNFSAQTVEIDPYILGYWLGDGSSAHAMIYTADKEIITRFHELLLQYGMDIFYKQDYAYSIKKINTIIVNNSPILNMRLGYKIIKRGQSWVVIWKGGKKTCYFNKYYKYPLLEATCYKKLLIMKAKIKPVANYLMWCLRRNNLLGNKHIPDQYKYNTRDVRLKLLAGVIDSDGYWNRYGYDIVLKSKQLMEDVIFVARSLGYNAYIKKTTKTCTNTGSTGTYYRTYIAGSSLSEIPCILSRKRAVNNKKYEYANIRSFKIEPAEIDDYYGFVLDGNHRFLLADCTVSHNSSLIKAVGCNIVLAQAGMFVSCTEFEYYPFRYLLSKMTIRDNMSKGQSTFMVEMLEVKNMLMRADPNTLVLSDELCSSTESTSGHAIVAQTLHALTQKKAKFMFATHLHELQKIPLVTENPHIKIYHFKVHIDGTAIVFDRHLEEGGMTELYGLEVARALGLPEEFMMGAFVVRDQLTEQPTEILSSKQSRYNAKVYVHSCRKCGSTKDLHTHHIRHQKDADSHGLIDGKFHKNRKFNLGILCKTCHTKEHFPEVQN